MRRYLALPAVLAIALLTLTGCGGGGGGDVIRVGAIAEMTGDMPAVGASFKSAAELAVKEVNDAGGLQVGDKKYKVELFLEDNAGKAEQSAAGAQKLITQNDVLAIVGPNPSRYAIPAAEICEQSKVLMVAPWSTNPKTTQDSRSGAPKKYVFRACFTDPFQGQVLAKFAKDNLKANKAAVLFDVASDYNKGLAEIFKASFEKLGGTVPAFESYTTNDKDFSAQLTKIKNAAPDVLFLPNYYTEVPLQVQQAHRLGINVPVLGSDSWGSAELLKLCEKDCEGYYFSSHYAADMATSAAQAFIGKFKAAYNNPPDDVAALTYDSFELVFEALRKAGKLDREAVRDAFSKISLYEGVTGTIKYQEGSGDPVKSIAILQVKDGKFKWHANVTP
jgi:branched-chain amino acid transport system substrate-binding protein